jgi:hypothetical protein
MLSYTKGTLKEALMLWNRNSAPQFEAELDHIIRRGELALFRAIDSAPMLDQNDTSTAALSEEVFKPSNLLRETALWVTVDGTRYPLLKRSPSWIKYVSTTPGRPRYYAERDTERWHVAPPAADAYLIEVDGEYAFESITDGNDDSTSYFSTTMPDLLYTACAIEACEFLKFWDHKDKLLLEFGAKVAIFRGDNANMEKTDAEDRLGGRDQSNPVKAPGA